MVFFYSLYFDEYIQHTCMHLQRVFRCLCLRLLQNASDATLQSVTEALLCPKRANSFGALYAIYRTAKDLVKKWFIFVSPVCIWFVHNMCAGTATYESGMRKFNIVLLGMSWTRGPLSM
jgi:hypothetical protein